MKAVEAISYATLFASLLSCKIVGLELFGVLQLAYFDLAEHDFLNVYLAPLVSFRSTNGYNKKVNSESSQPPQNI